MRGNQNAKGMTYTHTDVAKQAIGNAHRGKVLSEETKAKLSQNRAGKSCGERNAMSNPENRAKVGASKVGKRLHIGPNGERRLFIPSTAPAEYQAA